MNYKARSLSPLREGDTVWLPNGTSGRVLEQLTAPRSYNMETQSGTLQRNKRYLTLQPNEQAGNEVLNDKQMFPAIVNGNQQSTETNTNQLTGQLSLLEVENCLDHYCQMIWKNNTWK